MAFMKKSMVMLFLLLFLLACARGRKGEMPVPTDFRTGSQGLYMTFVPNLPPPRLFDREPFNVMIQVENRGTSPVGGPGDKIYLSGFDNTLITGINTDGGDIPIMEGRGPFMPQGGIDTVHFRGVIQLLGPKRIDKYNPIILATACYSYMTIASAQVCIDPNPYAPTSVQRVCIPTNVATGSQGAPIAITSVEVDAAPGKTRFKINVQNVGGGDAFRSGSIGVGGDLRGSSSYLGKCSPYNPGLSFDEIDFIRVADVSVSGGSIKRDCRPLDATDHIRLTNGQASLFCEFSGMLEQSPYLTPLNIILQYGYRQSISRPIEIRPVS